MHHAVSQSPLARRPALSMAAAIAAAISGLGSSGPAWAQQAAPQSSALVLEEIVVTARKVEEKLSDVPVTISAFSAADLQQRNATSLADIAAFTPGFSFESYSGGTTPAPLIRGLTQGQLTDRNQNVATFLDGVHVQQAGNVDLSMLDLEQVQIIKGPQNAQYGKSSFAGAINWVPKRPSLEDWEANVSATVGTDERLDYSASVSIPLWQDRLAVRLYGKKTEFDGTFKNAYPGSGTAIATSIAGYNFPGNEGNLGGWDGEAVQASLRFRPIENLTFDLLFYRSEIQNEPGAQIVIAPLSVANIAVATPAGRNPHNCSPNAAGINQLRCGEIPIDENQVFADPRNSGLLGRTEMQTARIAWKATETLTATYVFGRGLLDAANYQVGAQPELLVAGDGTQAGLLTIASNPFGDQESESHELRLDGKWGEVSWRIGYYHNEVDDFGATGLFSRRRPLASDPTGQFAVTQIPFLTANPQSLLSNFIDKTDSAFFSLSIPFADSWNVDLEGRDNTEKRRQVSFVYGFGPTGVPNGVVTPRDVRRKFSTFTPRVNLRWQPREEWTFYASGAIGEKSGGFNAVTADIPSFEPEENTTIELGTKLFLLDRRLQLNASIFAIDWKDLQLSVPDSIPLNPNSTAQEPNFIGNVKGADGRGIEFDAVMLINDRLRGNFMASYVDTTFKDGTIDTTFGRLCETTGTPVCTFLPRTRVGTVPGPLPLGGSPIGGNELPRSPSTQLAAGLEYRMPVGALELSLRGDLTYQSKFYAENLNLAYTPDRTLLNINVGLAYPDGAWNVNLWGKNVTDETYASSSFAVAVINQYVPALGLGAQFGLTANYNFKSN